MLTDHRWYHCVTKCLCAWAVVAVDKRWSCSEAKTASSALERGRASQSALIVLLACTLHCNRLLA